MAGNSTVYDVRVRYALDDRASKNAKGIASSFDKASGSAMSLKGALATIGGIAVLGKAKSALLDFNSEMDQMKIGLTAIMQMQLHMPFAKAKDEANKLFSVFQELAKKSPATTKDFMEMGSAIAPAVAMLGGGPDKLAKLAQGGVLASLAFGERADIVALDIKQMLAGTVGAKDRIAQQLLAAKGVKQDDFNAMDAGKRAGMVENMFQDPALLKAADQMGESFAGQVSTFKDMLQITLGQVGKPLMESITDEVRQWNTWIEKHPRLIKEYVSEFGGMIKSAFEFVKNVAGWLVDNRDLLFTIGKTFLVFKGAQMGVNIFKKFADGIGGLVGDLKNAGGSIKSLFSGTGEGSIFGRVKGLAGALGSAIPAVGLFVGAIQLATHFLNTHREEDEKARKAQQSISEALGEMPGMQKRRGTLKDMLAGKGMFAGGLAPEMKERVGTELANLESNLYDPKKLGDVLRKISDESEAHGGLGFKQATLADSKRMQNYLPEMFNYSDLEKTKKVTEEVMTFLDMFGNLTSEVREGALRAAFPEQYGMPKAEEAPKPASTWKDTDKPDVKVTIHKIEVASEDPDRFVFGLAKIGEQAAKHKTSSQHTTPGGF